MEKVFHVARYKFRLTGVGSTTAAMRIDPLPYGDDPDSLIFRIVTTGNDQFHILPVVSLYSDSRTSKNDQCASVVINWIANNKKQTRFENAALWPNTGLVSAIASSSDGMKGIHKRGVSLLLPYK